MLNPFLGSLGRLVEVPFTASEDVSRADRYSEVVTVEGQRRVQVRPSLPRSWSVDVPVGSGADVSGLMAFASGAWGYGPWHWVSVAAQVGNLLTPRESVFLDRVSHTSLTDAGPVKVADGSWAARSVGVALPSGWVATHRSIPVVPGRPFTWSADVEAGGGEPPYVQFAFYDAAGNQLAAHSQGGSGTGMQRLSVSAVTPAGAVYVNAGVRYQTGRVARPQASWTDGAVPFSQGHGCRSAVVDGVSQDLLVVNARGPHGSTGFTVLEVS